MRVRIDQEQARYVLETGESIEIEHWGEAIRLEADGRRELPTPPVEDLPRPVQPAGRGPTPHRG
jgi:Glycosyl hydrolase family 65, C-terminal domain